MVGLYGPPRAPQGSAQQINRLITRRTNTAANQQIIAMGSAPQTGYSRGPYIDGFMGMLPPNRGCYGSMIQPMPCNNAPTPLINPGRNETLANNIGVMIRDIGLPIAHGVFELIQRFRSTSQQNPDYTRNALA